MLIMRSLVTSSIDEKNADKSSILENRHYCSPDMRLSSGGSSLFTMA